MLGPQTQATQRMSERLRVRLFAQRVSTADSRVEHPRQAELAKLAVHAVAVTAGNQTQSMLPRNPQQHALRASYKSWSVPGVMPSPRCIRRVPMRTRQACGAVYVIPVRRVM